MKNIFIYFSIFLITISCTNFYNSAENYYSSEKYYLAKNELVKIQKTSSDYKKAQLLIIKIDSILITRNNNRYYQLALENYSNNYLEKAKKILKNINSKSLILNKKVTLLEKIDSSTYLKAFELYTDNYLIKSNETLDKINFDSKYYRKKLVLSKQVLKKIKHNSRKEKYISKAVISSIFGPSPSIMKVKSHTPGVFIVSYYSRDAGRSYSYKVKFANNKAFWGADNGRWRNDNISYTETNNAYYIIEKYGDGSIRKDKFYKYKLK